MRASALVRAGTRGISGLGLAAAIVLGGPQESLVAQKSISFPNFDATIQVERDGTVRVLEQIRVRFVGSWNGIYRKIPVVYETPQGFGYKLFLKVESVTGSDGEPLEHWIEDERGYRSIKIRVPNAQDVERVVAIRYSAPNALRFHEDFDELYWNVTGTEWDVPIGAASARVVLPDGATGTRTAAFTGYFGATGEDARVQDLGDEFFFETTRELGFREGLTIAVGWDPGLVDRPGSFTKAWWFLRANFLILIPIFPFLFFFHAWKTRGRDPKTGSIVAQYDPPDGLRPAEVGTLIDNKPNMHDLTATLVDLAVRGYIHFEEFEKKGFLRNSTEIQIHRVKEKESWDELHAHERRTLVGLFDSGNGETVTRDDLKNEFYTHLGGIKDGIWDKLLEKGYYDERPDKVAGRWVGGAVVVSIAVFVGGLVLADKFFLSVASAFVAGILTAIPALIFASLMPARTRSGVAALERVLGFEEFLSRVDGDRLRRMNADPETFERLLPYAMALRAEDRWAKAFEGIYTEPPEWYTGSHRGPFTPRIFVGDLGGFTRAASTTMASSPSRSSGGSGFSSGGGGGGFSGGGMGGGGGGGW